MIHLPQERASQTRFIVLLTGIATTFFVWSPLADPINMPKMFVLTILSAWVLGPVITGAWSNMAKGFSLGQWANLGFGLSILISALLTDVKHTAFYGALQRNDGAFSYLALAVLAFAGTMTFTISNLVQLRTVLFWIGSVLAGYGLLQTTHHDLIHWNLVYNPIVGTLGNPDFMSALIGVCSIATLWNIFAAERKWMQAVSAASLFFELFVVKRSGSSQGLFVFAVGFSILIVTEIWHRNRRAGVLSLGLVGVGAIPVFLGVFDVGPFASRIYRSSIGSRIDYWHAAISMFKAHPFAGVGLDRFADSYGQYAPQVQVAQDQYTNNAHNVFLQLLATGGLLVLLPYLLFLGVIFYAAVQGIRAASGREQRDLIALSAIWFALLLISAISIDNLGTAVWFWISSGALYGITHRYVVEKAKPETKKKSVKVTAASASDEMNFVSPIISFALAFIILLLMIPAWKSSAMLMDWQRYQGGLSSVQLAERIKQTSAVQPGNIDLQLSLADIALRTSEFDLAFNILKSVNRMNPRSLNGNYLAAIGFEMSKEYGSAIPFRKRLLVIDRWSTRNMLALVKDYVLVGDLTSARSISRTISELRPDGDDAKAAEATIKG